MVNICILFLARYVHGQGSKDEVCVLLKYCPFALNILRNPHDYAGREILKQKICGFDGHYEKIWCRIPCSTPRNEDGNTDSTIPKAVPFQLLTM